MKKIVVVGGGSAGTMSAYTLKKLFPEKEIVLLESKDIPSVGVGESTLAEFNQWLAMVDLKDEQWMKHCNATYKMSVKFNDFYTIGDGGFHYPFGYPSTENLNDWYIKKMVYPDTPVTDYAESHYSIMALINENKILTDKQNEEVGLPNYSFKRDVAYHFDAVMFANWLREEFKKIGGKHITGTVHKVMMTDEAILSVFTEKESIGGDLFIDCTGFKSVLLGEKLKEPFISFEDILPNNSAWAAQIPYTNQEKEMLPYTDCTALSSGWVWKVTLWSRMGSGYVYSDKFIDDEKALEEFKKHTGKPELKYRNIKFQTGRRRRTFVRNVVAIGLSAGFVEPLESNGLLSVHRNLFNLVRLLKRGRITNYLKDHYNLATARFFTQFAEFVASHFALSERMDSHYWRAVQNRHYHFSDENAQVNSLFQNNNFWVYDNYQYPHSGGMHCIAAGMNFIPFDDNTAKYNYYANNVEEFLDGRKGHIHTLIDQRNSWKKIVSDNNIPTLYKYLKEYRYD